MEDVLKKALAFSDALTVERVTGDGRLVCPTPAYLAFISVCPAIATAICEAKIYDGHNTTEKIVLDFESMYAQVCTCIAHPLRFNKGIYCELTLNVKSITLAYLSIPE